MTAAFPGIRYLFDDDRPIPIKAAAEADPQVIGDALAAIMEANGGRLEAPDVVEAAKHRRHPLHKHFEWDDAAAAHAHRLDQARCLIRIMRVEDPTTETGLARAFLSVADREGRSYRATNEVARSMDLQLAVLKDAERDLAAWEQRYASIQDLCQDVKVMREKLKERLRRAEEARRSGEGDSTSP